MVDTKTAEISGLRQGALKTLYYGSMVFAVGVVVQFYLAGEGIFAATGTLRHASSLDPHRTFGNVLAGLSVLLLIIGIIARPGGRVLAAVIAMFVLTGIEGTIASLGKTSAYLGAIHPVFAAAILVLALIIPWWTRNGFAGLPRSEPDED